MASYTVGNIYGHAQGAAPMDSFSRARAYLQERNLLADKRLPPRSDALRRTTGDTTDLAIARQPKKPAYTELRRQRNREHQARYKTKQNNKLLELENGIERLQQEIQELKMQRQIISIGVPGQQSKWGVAAEYFRLFRSGLRGPKPVDGPASPGSLVPVESNAQRQFLQTTMASNVVGAVGCGVDALLLNWRLITLYLPDVDIQLLRLENGPEDTLIAHTRGTHSITEDTLRYAFPHLIDGCEYSAMLACRLLGCQLAISGCTQLIWDEEAGRMASIQYTADMLTPMLQLLGSLEDVSKVFSNARVNSESRFVVSPSCP